MALLLPSVAVAGLEDPPDSEGVVIEEGNIHLHIFTSVLIKNNKSYLRGAWGLSSWEDERNKTA